MKKILIAVVLSAVPAFAFAQNTNIGGCGWGAKLFDGQSGVLPQVLAVTTNGTSGNQTFGITTGTSNCADTGGGMASIKSFTETNREALAKDMSRGQGETLKNLAVLAGCTDASAVGVTLQKNYSSIIPNAATPTEQVSDSIISTLRSQKALGCAKLG